MKYGKSLLVIPVATAIGLCCGAAVADTTVIQETTTVDVPVTTSTVTTHTETAPLPVTPGARQIDFMAFDADHDGILTRAEIGNGIFRLYDTDGNDVIDNIEYERKAVLTVVPMEQSSSIKYDYDGDGVADRIVDTYQPFLELTQLARFDKNLDGLSPHEFLGRDFLQADVDKSKAIEMKEWQGAYDEELDRRNKRAAEVNH